jgi:hypothetical protein
MSARVAPTPSGLGPVHSSAAARAKITAKEKKNETDPKQEKGRKGGQKDPTKEINGAKPKTEQK